MKHTIKLDHDNKIASLETENYGTLILDYETVMQILSDKLEGIITEEPGLS